MAGSRKGCNAIGRQPDLQRAVSRTPGDLHRLHRSFIDRAGNRRAAPVLPPLLITWQEGDDIREVEIRMDRRQWINLQNRFYSIPPFIWRRNMPKSLDDLIDGAIRSSHIKPV